MGNNTAIKKKWKKWKGIIDKLEFSITGFADFLVIVLSFLLVLWQSV